MSDKGKVTDGMSEEELNARHAEKMRRKKEARDKIIATKTVEKGLLIVHTGKGKGKSTAAFGMGSSCCSTPTSATSARVRPRTVALARTHTRPSPFASYPGLVDRSASV